MVKQMIEFAHLRKVPRSRAVWTWAFLSKSRVIARNAGGSIVGKETLSQIDLRRAR